MKNIKKLIVFMCMIILTASLSASGKNLKSDEAVYFTNELNQKLAIVLEWGGSRRMDSEIKEEYVLNVRDKEIMFNPPRSGYYLIKINVMLHRDFESKNSLKSRPDAKIFMNFYADKEVEMKVRKDVFFVICNRNAGKMGPIKLEIKGYPTREDYEKEITKIEPKKQKIAAQVVNAVIEPQVLNNNLTKESLELEQKKLALQLDQLAFEEKQLAFKEKQLAFERNNSVVQAQDVVAAA